MATPESERLRQRAVLFIQGGGEGTHDDWDNKLVESLRRELGADYEVRYPRMPDEDDPSYAKWSRAIRQELGALQHGAVVVGHSIGGTILAGQLAEEAPPVVLSAIVLLATPFVGEGGWPADEFEFGADLAARLPDSVPVHLFHGLDDDEVPPAHADLYARAIPRAQVYRLAGRDHQLGNDLSEVASVIRAGGLAPLDRAAANAP